MRYLGMLVFLVWIILFSTCSKNETCGSQQSELKLWYKQPASKWVEALPVGNGRLGAMVFGKVDSERIQLNEESLWAGTRINNNNPQAAGHLKEIQKLLLAGKNTQAVILAKKYLLGTPPRIRSYQTLADLNLAFRYTADSLSGYRRDLDLSAGISTVRYRIGKTQYTREVFASAPDNSIVVHITTDQPGQINVDMELSREIDANTRFLSERALLMEGQIIDRGEPHRGPPGAHMKFAARLDILQTDGKVTPENGRLQVKDASELTFVITAATDYNMNILNFDRSIDPVQRCETIISAIGNKSYDQIRSVHLSDHRAMFDRVQLDLGPNPFPERPTDQRLQKVRDGGTDADLVALYFQYGRYLLMGSSRAPGILPANLQGIWNEHLDAPWSSDFHTNINLQMNYWPAEMCNLPETVLPLTRFFTHLQEPGKQTAREMYGARGWMMHHVTDPFGRTGLMDGVQWGTSPLAGAWMSLTFWRHYQFTRDRDYLQSSAYPIMKQAAQFILDFLIEDGNGRLVTAPSVSPENAYIDPVTGEEHQLSYAATIDIEIINELFTACIESADLLGEEAGFATELRSTLQKLPPIQVGRDGTIREWIEDYEEAEPGHRHMSHLFGLHPGSQITPETPELFRAAGETIRKRLANGGGHTGWSRAWIINFYARLLDAQAAYDNVQALLQKSTLDNLFDSHPPFQIDGNFGGTAGIGEMLLQSHNREIHLLPALPAAWPSGSVSGMKARGNFEINLKWQSQKLSCVEIKSLSGGTCRIRYQDRVKEFETRSGQVYRLNQDLEMMD